MISVNEKKNVKQARLTKPLVGLTKGRVKNISGEDTIKNESSIASETCFVPVWFYCETQSPHTLW